MTLLQIIRNLFGQPIAYEIADSDSSFETLDLISEVNEELGGKGLTVHTVNLDSLYEDDSEDFSD